MAAEGPRRTAGIVALAAGSGLWDGAGGGRDPDLGAGPTGRGLGALSGAVQGRASGGGGVGVGGRGPGLGAGPWGPWVGPTGGGPGALIQAVQGKASGGGGGGRGWGWGRGPGSLPERGGRAAEVQGRQALGAEQVGVGAVLQ